VPDGIAGGRVTLRLLSSADHPAVLELAGALRRYFSPRDLAEIGALLGRQPSGWVALAGDELAGFLLDAPAAEPAVRELAWMAVAAHWQRRGIGSALLDALLEDARARGDRAIEVATVAQSAGYAPYEATRAFYHHRGFVDVRVDPDYYWPGGDRLVLRRALAP
jgi:GNAT superfamily N-acetyltransferase